MPRLISEDEVRPVCCGRKMIIRGKAQSGNTRYRCSECGTSTTASNPEAFDERQNLGYPEEVAAENAERVRKLVRKGHKRFVVAAVQNNTRLHPSWPALLQYCEQVNAELIVIPIHHKNISLYTAAQEYQKRWPAEVLPYIVDEHITLGGGVDIAGELKIAATAARPLSGLGPMGGHNWQIIGHSKRLMEPVATPQNMKPKRLYTTGVMSVRNYSRTKQGALAEFHHSVGAMVVEIDNRKTAFVRHLSVKGKGFYDIANGQLRHYTADGSVPSERALALTTGDEHVKFYDKGVYKATYGPEGMATKLKPKYLFRHDVLDGYAGSHHHEKDPTLQFKKFHNGDDDYRAELDETIDFINKTTPEGTQCYIVDSNHHDHLTQWLNRANANRDHRNALLILELQEAVRLAVLKNQDASPFELYCKGKTEARFMSRNEPFIVKGVEYSQHGDVGVNGARGSARGIAQSTHQSVIGHSHTARIVDGCYQVGYSAADLEYAKGLGTWTHTHCLQYPDGGRTLVDIFNAKWHI